MKITYRHLETYSEGEIILGSITNIHVRMIAHKYCINSGQLLLGGTRIHFVGTILDFIFFFSWPRASSADPVVRDLYVGGQNTSFPQKNWGTFGGGQIISFPISFCIYKTFLSTNIYAFG